MNLLCKMQEILEDALPHNHPYLASLYNNVAILLQSEGKFEGSINYFLKCERFEKKCFLIIIQTLQKFIII